MEHREILEISSVLRHGQKKWLGTIGNHKKRMKKKKEKGQRFSIRFYLCTSRWCVLPGAHSWLTAACHISCYTDESSAGSVPRLMKAPSSPVTGILNLVDIIAVGRAILLFIGIIDHETRLGLHSSSTRLREGERCFTVTIYHSRRWWCFSRCCFSPNVAEQLLRVETENENVKQTRSTRETFIVKPCWHATS